MAHSQGESKVSCLVNHYLCTYICWIVSRGYIFIDTYTLLLSPTHCMVLHIYVTVIMGHTVLRCQLLSCSIIAVDDGGSVLREAHLVQELPEVDGLVRGEVSGWVFCL